jgi:uncharacterized membrane protein YhhN
MTSRTGPLALAAGALAALVYLAAPSSAPAWLLAGLKPLPVLALAVWCRAGGGGTTATSIAAGLVVSAVGDVLLALDRFLAGVAVFLAAHVLYTSAFLAWTRRPRLLRLVGFLAWGAAVYSLIAPVLGALLVPVGAYVLAACVMMWRAAATLGASGGVRREEWWALAGAVLFGASDTLLALHRFLTPWPDAPFLVMLLYWAGQAGIARSARRAAGNSAVFQYHHAGPPAA